MSLYDEWLGREEERHDRLDPARSNALLAALGRPAELREGDPLPLLHHWMSFWDVRPPSETGEDGHPRRGGFLPPVELPRRMWAGGAATFEAPLILGEMVRRLSRIEAIERKDGRSGTLIFVTVSHEFDSGGGVALRERQDLVYREPGSTPPPPPGAAAAPAPNEVERILPDAVLLFRYSALTMNSHRIHYDHPYATQVEGYPGLVAHGPLQATLLAGLAERRLGGPLKSFSFRGLAPAFDGLPLSLCADEGGFWTEQGGRRAMEAKASR